MSDAAEFGAMVIVAPPDLLGHDIEISRSGSDRERTKSVVRRRVRRNSPPQYTAEYPTLAPGEYTIWRGRGDDVPVVTVTVGAGKVTEVTLADRRKDSSLEM